MLNMRQLPKLAPLALAAVSISGCASLNTYQSADCLEAGKMDFSIRPQYASVIDPSSGQSIMLPSMDFAVRYGMNGKSDFGARLGTSGLTFDLKFQLAKSKGMAIAINPGIGGVYGGVPGIGGLGYLDVSFPLIIGLKPSKNFEFVVVPKVIDRLYFAGAGGESGKLNMLMPGVGFGMTLSPNPTFRIQPELTLAMPIMKATESVTGSTASASGGGLMANFGVGIAFGGPYNK